MLFHTAAEKPTSKTEQQTFLVLCSPAIVNSHSILSKSHPPMCMLEPMVGGDRCRWVLRVKEISSHYLKESLHFPYGSPWFFPGYFAGTETTRVIEGKGDWSGTTDECNPSCPLPALLHLSSHLCPEMLLLPHSFSNLSSCPCCCFTWHWQPRSTCQHQQGWGWCAMLAWSKASLSGFLHFHQWDCMFLQQPYENPATKLELEHNQHGFDRSVLYIISKLSLKAI